MLYFILIALSIGAQQSYCLQEDYYWREYTGAIPEDALVAGEKSNGKSIYIGQAYVKNQGLIVAEIIEGKKEVKVPSYGVKKVHKHVKILCGIQQNFYWAPANATDLHLSLIGKRPIIGGFETGGTLYIGRISYEGNIKVGKIISYQVGNALLYFTNSGREHDVNSYEIFLYNDNAVDVRLKTLIDPITD